MTTVCPQRQSYAKLLPLGAAIFLLFVTGCAGTPEPRTQLDAIRGSDTLRVGTTGDFAPFSYRHDGSDTLYGVDIGFARKLADGLGVKVEFVQTSWPELMDDLLADRFDIGMSGITITPERLSVAFFSLPVMSSGKVAITRDENAHRFRTIPDINRAGVRVIVNPGGTNEAFARANFPQATIVLNEENLTVFDKIISGDVDLMVTDAVEAAVQEVVYPGLEISNRESPFNTFEFGLLMPRDQELKNYVDDWLEEQRTSQTYRQLFDAELLMIETRANTDG
ncbi:MAG: transporter substrate-binding domain-containing protein [Woeseiaceae bacterium]